MSPEERDPAHLWDMLVAAERVASYVRGATRSGYLADQKTRHTGTRPR
ncbi:MAG: hypothetical protein ACYTKD_08615 [Planctomycetota bacterium]|jgi:uncharacterized protein with HEPN domain